MNDLEKMRAGRWLHAVTPEIGAALLRSRGTFASASTSCRPPAAKSAEAIIRQPPSPASVRRPCLHSPFHCDFGTQISVGDHFVGNFHLRSSMKRP